MAALKRLRPPLLCALLLASFGAPSSAAADETRYCVPVETFDFNPFRPVNDGKELAYLIFLRSFISTVPDEPGVLSRYEFSPDGRRFRARIDESARWADGAPVSAREAAYAVALGFANRPIGRRVRVAGGDRLGGGDPLNAVLPGIRILDDRTFELRFESRIANVTGAVREALSTNSRQNRIWVVRLAAAGQRGGWRVAAPVEVLGRHAFGYRDGHPGFQVGSHFVRLAASSECAGADYGIYSENLAADMSAYASARSTRPQAVTFQPNTRRLNLADRKAVAAWVRAAFASAPPASGFRSVPAFFLPGEPGYDPASEWPRKQAAAWSPRGKLRLAVESPILRSVVASAARAQGIDLELVDLPLKNPEVDGQLLGSSVQDGRQIILQDLLDWSFVGAFMENAPRTRASLKTIAKLSASTIPPDATTLRDFERAARQEYALVPVARRDILAFSKKSAPLRIEWLASGEPLFKAK